MTFDLVDRIEKYAADNPIGPALINVFGSTSYYELFDNVIKTANYFDDRKLPFLGRALLNFSNPDLRFIAYVAAVEYGLVPIVASPDTVKAEYDYDFVVGSPEPFWKNVPNDLVIDQSVLTGKFADNKRRKFRERADGDLVYVAETTGTTGRPKLVALTYEAYKKSVMDSRRRYTRLDRIVYTIGGATRYGLLVSERAIGDGAASIAAPLSPLECLKMINLFNITHLLTTPVYLEQALVGMEDHGMRCPSIRNIRLTGAFFGAKLLGRVENCFNDDVEIHVGYGTSEVGGISSGTVSSKTYRRGYVGKVRPDLKFLTYGTRENPSQLKIFNDQRHFSKYIKDGEVRSFEGEMYDIPDIGYFEDGHLYLVGRSDEVFNFSGNLKAYSLIEEEIEKIAPVSDVAVIDGTPAGIDHGIIIAVVSDRMLDLEDISDKLLAKLMMRSAKSQVKFFQPREIERNKMGKIDRRKILESYRSH